MILERVPGESNPAACKYETQLREQSIGERRGLLFISRLVEREMEDIRSQITEKDKNDAAS